MTPKEAREVLQKCYELRRAVDRLCIKAMKAMRGNLKVIEGGKCS